MDRSIKAACSWRQQSQWTPLILGVKTKPVSKVDGAISSSHTMGMVLLTCVYQDGIFEGPSASPTKLATISRLVLLMSRQRPVHRSTKGTT